MTIRKVAEQAALKSGKVLLDLAKKQIKYEMKSSHDILAEADLKSEKIIINTIKEYFPSHGIFSEESGEIKGDGYVWIIDPVDGTINYSRKMDDYCISIAVEKNGVIIFGLVYQPVLNRIYIAEKGKGCFLNNRRVKVSSENKLVNSIVATDNSGNLEKRKLNFKKLSVICDQFRNIRVSGNGCLNLARIAVGQMDCYFANKFNYWDYATGVILISEAGGKVTDYEGKLINKNSASIIASNNKLHKKLLSVIKESI